MTKNLFLASALFLSLPVGACGFFTGLFTTEDVAIDYVGQIALGTPFNSGKKTNIPFNFTGGKWLENSGIAFKKVNGNVNGQNINFTIQTCLASGGSKTQEKIISVKKLTSGEYRINYINPNGSSVLVGKIKI